MCGSPEPPNLQAQLAAALADHKAHAIKVSAELAKTKSRHKKCLGAVSAEVTRRTKQQCANVVEKARSLLSLLSLPVPFPSTAYTLPIIYSLLLLQDTFFTLDHMALDHMQALDHMT